MPPSITEPDADLPNPWESNAREDLQVTFDSQIKKLVQAYAEYMEGTDDFRQIQDVAAEILYSHPGNIRISSDTTSLGAILWRYWWLALAPVGTLLLRIYILSISFNEVSLNQVIMALFSFLLSFFKLAILVCFLLFMLDSSGEKNVRPTDNDQHSSSRLTWKCICRDTRTVVVPHHFARRLVEIREETLPLLVISTTTAPTPASSFHTPTTSSILLRNPWPQPFNPSPEPSSFSEESPELAYHYAGTRPPATYVSMGSRYILFMVNTGGLRLHEIDTKWLSNDQLFDGMRFRYRQSKGWFRTWFGLSIFSHCDFCKFESWAQERYCERGGGIPPVSEAGYFYMPRPMDNEPPISKHEFYDRFYKRLPSEQDMVARGWPYGGHDAVDRIPQRKGIKMIQTNGRLQFWGIVAREEKSGTRMLVYILLSSLPGFMFFFLWLFALNKDSLQDASTLLMISFSLLGILYATQLL